MGGAMRTLTGDRWICAVIAAAVLLLTSCSAKGDLTDQTDPQKNIALILKASNGDYWKTVRMGAEAAAKEFNVNLSIASPDREEDVKGQIELVNQAIKDGADGLVLAANDFKSLAEVTDRAADRDIPVITIDSEVDSAKVRSYIGINNYEAGQKAGQKLVELVGDKGRIAVMSFGKGAKNPDQREQGLLDELSKHPQIQVAGKEYCYSDPKLCGELTEKLLANDNRIDGLAALNAISSMGAATAIQKLGLTGKVKVITFDNTPEDIGFLQDGVIQATIIQNPFSMGYLGVKYAVEAMDDKKTPEFVDTGTKVIDQENMFWLDNQKLLFPFVQ
jgi:ribose transport system substrate-binding protein